MYLTLTKNILLRQKQISFLKQSYTNTAGLKLLNNRIQTPPLRQFSSSKGTSPGKSKIKRAAWLIAFGSVPFTYFIGLSIRESQDEEIKFEKDIEIQVQQRLKEKIAAFEALPEEERFKIIKEVKRQLEEEEKD